jgi:hypothetical protein
MRRIACIIFSCVCLAIGLNASGQSEPSSKQALGLKVPFKLIGTIEPLNAKEVTSSMWSIGGETLDRDNADYNSYKKYLGPLGAKRIRLQGGWAKTEKIKGQYNFLWLDSIVNDAVRRGLQPWMELSYGNEIYPGGGNPNIGSPLPSSPEALKAWDNWVEAIVNRYKNKIGEWEIWNEINDARRGIPAEQYAEFYIRTDNLVRQQQPKAKLIALALTTGGYINTTYTEAFLQYMEKAKQLPLVDVITFHFYAPKPEEMSLNLLQFSALVAKYSKNIKLWQGESGCPSTSNSSGGLREISWSELSQAKYILRRMLDDAAHQIELSNIFQISDMIGYNGKTNSKGLLKANSDKSIAYAKPAYYAMQHVVSVFNNVSLVTDSKIATNAADSTSLFVYGNKEKGKKIISLCIDKQRPSDTTKVKFINISVAGTQFKKPVYVDLLNGNIYEIPKENYTSVSGGKFLNIPVTDYPVLITEAALVGR